MSLVSPKAVSELAGRLAMASVCAVMVMISGWPAVSFATAGEGEVGAAPAPGAPGVLASGDYFAPTIAAGSTWASVLLVSNGGTTAVPIVVYAADGLTAHASGAVYSNLGQPLKAAGTWLAPAPRTIRVRADGQRTVRFHVTVPKDATPGDHLAGIVVQSGVPEQAGSGNFRVNIVSRAVVGVLVRVPGPASFDVRVGKPTFERGPDQIGEVVTPITDTGRLLGKPVDSVALRGPHGYRHVLRRDVDTVLPGGTADFPIYWPGRLHGIYEVTACVSGSGLKAPVCNSGTVRVASATGAIPPTTAATVPTTRVTLPGGKHREGDGPGHAAPSPGVPSWSIALVSAGVGCVLGGAVMHLRRSRRQGRGR